MTELFDYGGIKPLPSLEVSAYEVEQTLISEDWRKRASDHFRQVEGGFSRDNFAPALGALMLANSSEKDRKTRKAEIDHWESVLQIDHYNPNN